MFRAIAFAAVALLLAAVGADRAAAQATSEITVILGGYGDVALTDGSYRCTNADFASGGCPPLTSTVGSTLTFTASPAPVTGPEPGFDPAPDPTTVQSRFVGWSRPECESLDPCSFTVADDQEAIVASFSPVWLEVLVSGAGAVAANGVTSPCTTERCIMGPYENGARIDVTGTPTPAPGDWGFGCDPFDSDLLGGHCIVEMANIRNFVSVGFQGVPPETEPPYNLSKPLTVRLDGDGRGRVEGAGNDAAGEPWKIDCGAVCRLGGIQYQTRVRLRASAAAGSSFVRWSGPPCGGQPVCTFTAGKHPTVNAVFSLDFAVSVRRARASGRGGRRKVGVTVSTNRDARATLTLTRGRKWLASKSFSLSPGTRRIKLRVPRRVRRGWCTASLAVTAADGATRTFSRRVKLKR